MIGEDSGLVQHADGFHPEGKSGKHSVWYGTWHSAYTTEVGGGAVEVGGGAGEVGGHREEAGGGRRRQGRGRGGRGR